MFYRVVRSKNNEVCHYDFDEIEDARRWIELEISFDENGSSPVGYSYSICEIYDDIGHN